MSNPPAQTIQATQGTAVPIQAVAMPPEGQRGIQQTYTFTPTGLLTTGAVLQLNQPGGLALSQVVSLCIDNTQNPNSITVTHGVFQETITVAAGGFQVVPTFSTKSTYSILLTLPAAPSVNVPVSIIFLNYNRQQYNIQSNGSQVSNNSQQSEALASQFFDNSSHSIVVLNPVPDAYYLITDFDIVVSGLEAGAGPSIAGVGVGFATYNGSFFTAGYWNAGVSLIPSSQLNAFQLANKTGLQMALPIGLGLGLLVSSGGLDVTPPIIPQMTFNVSYILVNVA